MVVRYSLLTLAAAAVLAAQHHGGGGGGGSHFSGSSAFHGSVAHAPSTPPSIGLQTYPSGYTGINRGAYSSSTRYGWPPSTPIRINRTLGRSRVVYYGYPYYPFVGYGDSWYDPTAYDAPYDPNYVQQEPLYDPAGYAPYAPGPYGPAMEQQPPVMLQAPPPAAGPDPAATPATPIVLVLRSGEKVEVSNYAIMNGVLWDFTKTNSKRIPLSNIDGPASAKATDAAGGSFPEGFFGANPN